MLPATTGAQERGVYPTAAQVEALLRREPLSAATWPAWKERLTAWFHDPTPAPDAAYWAAKHFFHGQSGGKLALPAPFATDHLAWYFLSGAYLHAPAAPARDLAMGEAACRRSIALAPAFPRGHRNLAMAIIAAMERDAGPAQRVRLAEAERALAEAHRLDPQLDLSALEARIARLRSRSAAPISSALRWSGTIGAVLLVGGVGLRTARRHRAGVGACDPGPSVV